MQVAGKDERRTGTGRIPALSQPIQFLTSCKTRAGETGDSRDTKYRPAQRLVTEPVAYPS